MLAVRLSSLKEFTGPKISYVNLRKLNLVAAVLYALQGIAILILADPNRGIAPVTTSYLTQDKLASEAAGQPVLVTASHHLFDIRLAYLVATFFFIGAVAHWLIANNYFKKYKKDLRRGINRARWIEYALSAGTTMVGIGLLSGIEDSSSLLMIFGLTAIMGLLGWVMEVHNQTTTKTSRLSYWIGIIAGIIPWLVLLGYVKGAVVYGNGLPKFIYFIYASLFILFVGFVVNMYLQYREVGRWSNYLYSERVYIVLGLLASSALAWQIYAGALR